MDFSHPARSAELSLFCVQLLMLLRRDDAAQALHTQAELMQPGVDGSSYTAATPLTPNWAWVHWPGVLLVLIDGTTHNTQALAMLEALQQPMTINLVGGANTYYIDQATAISNSLIGFFDSQGTRVIIACHSLGSGIGHILAQIMDKTVWTGNFSLITYGGPRPGPTQFARMRRSADIARWMNFDDPVPQVPPRQGQAQVFYALLNQTGRLNSNAYVHTHGGFLLTTDGQVADVDVQDVPTITLEFNLAAWLVQLNLDVNNPHNQQRYADNLAARVRLIGPVNLVDSGSTHAGQAVHVSSREIQRQVDRTVNEMNGLTREGNNTPTIIPEAMAFTAKRRGSVWVTLLRGQEIAIGPTRRRARHLAGLGNRWLHTLQIEGRVDTASLVNAFSLYLDDASDPTQGFKPVMRS